MGIRRQEEKMTTRQKVQTIEIDCPPGYPRPEDLYEGIIKGTSLPFRGAISKLFGEWTWDYSDISKEIFDKARPILKQRIELLYHKGIIRYGSWQQQEVKGNMEEILETIYHIVVYPFYVAGRLLQTIILLPVYIIAAFRGTDITVR